MRHLIISVVLLCTCFTVNAWQCPVLKDSLEAEASSKLFQGQQKFTIKFLQEALKNKPHKNIFFSPYSIYRVLLLAYAGSEGTTETTLKNALFLDWSKDKSDVITEYKHDKTQRLKNAKLETSVEFDSVDKFFFDRQVSIRDCMKILLSEEIELLEIQNKPDDAVKYINAWVEQVTRNQIKNLFTPDAIDKTTPLAVANAAYFKGFWLKKFDETNTAKEDFFKTPNESVPVDMMKHTDEFSWAIYDSYNVLELPYNKSHPEGNDISMVIVLPTEETVDAIDKVINGITTERFSEILKKHSNMKLNVWLPKFAFEDKVELKTILEKMGFSHMFSHDADFSGFSESTTVGFSEAVHKAKIEVDESGAKAAAATGLAIKRIGPFSFHIKQPFLYMIYDFTTNAVLFAGVYRGPK